MYSLDTLSELNFELSSHCNSKCPQCPRYDMFGNVRHDLNVTHLELDIIKSLPIEKMKNLNQVTFCGNFGDPLMHPQLDDIIDIFRNQHISISTNASLRNKEWWGRLGTKKNIEVTFCIDGIGVAHERYRRNTSYDKIMENAKAFIQSGGTARWVFIVFKHNEHQLDEAKKLSEEIGFAEIEFFYSDRFDTNDKWKVYDNNKYLYDLEKSSHQTTLRKSLSAPKGEKYWKNLNKNKGEITCVWSQKKKLYIHSDGTVYPCCWLGSVQAGINFEKVLLKKIIKDFGKIDLHNHGLDYILDSKIFKENLPKSFNGNPLQHPICIEYCNKSTGRGYVENRGPRDQ